MSRGTLFWGSLLVIVGGALLLDNLGLLGGISIWSILWPFMLIAIGAWIIWGNFFRRGSEQEHVSIPLEDFKYATVKLQHGAGKLRVASGASPGVLLEGDIVGGLDLNSSRQGDRLDVKMNPSSFSWFPGTTLDWKIALSRDVSLSLEMETGASDTHLDLSELRVSELRLKSGASSTVLTLPTSAGQTKVSIESGAASVDVRVPNGVAATIRSRGGLSSVSVDRSRFPRQGDIFRSDDYESANNKVDLDIQMGVGSVSIH